MRTLSIYMNMNSCVSSSIIFVRKNSTNPVIDSFWVKLDNELNQTPSGYQKSNTSQYKDSVLTLLHTHKSQDHTNESLITLQKEIESLTSYYDDIANIYQSSPDLLKILIKDEDESARDYLRRCALTSDDLDIIESFDQYTLEGIIIYALGSLFNGINETPAVRMSTLIEQLDSLTKTHSRLMKDREISLQTSNSQRIQNKEDIQSEEEKQKKDKRSKKEKEYSLGVYLVQFLINRKIITLSNDLSFSDLNITKKKNEKYYTQKTLFVILNFDLSILPIKLNLPMVCPPLAWEEKNPKDGSRPKSLNDLSGGYLSNPIGIYYSIYRYNLLSTRDMNHFYIMLGNLYPYLLNTMNALQKVPFEINSNLLKLLLNNRSLLD